ncbi:MAG: LytR C-terminal domain-containing protein [Coriobacteriia bacterium]|nr:LytR C-terminal domain-containing protein [Coriobacteriia bacterium]
MSGSERPVASTEQAAERLRRAKVTVAPEVPSGYRSSRRGSKAAKSAKRARRAFRVREVVTGTVDWVHRGAWVGVRVAVVAAAGAAAVVLALFLLALGINATARWVAVVRAGDGAGSALSESARENVLVVAVEGDRARGFLALRAAEKEKRVFGLAIPDGAFMEVPGQGFERIGDSYHAGPEVSMAAVSNYLSVPFERYLVVDASVYEQVLQKQSVAGLLDASIRTDLTPEEADRFRRIADVTPTEDVLIVPLPVKPITLGDETYFEPRRAEVAELIESWWGVKLTGDDGPARVIVYNGSGVPGIAGHAARQLIRGGYRVVDTKNADRFGYAETLIIVQHPGEVDPEGVRKTLGVGKVVSQPSDQRIADVIVIIGKDYAPPQDG